MPVMDGLKTVEILK